MLRRLAAELRARTLGQIQKESKDALLLQGRIASWLVRSKETITSLRDVEFNVLSQFGEDGIIDWIIERSQIPDRLHSFIEFGVELYEEANTRFLLENRNWRGLIIDANSKRRFVIVLWRGGILCRPRVPLLRGKTLTRYSRTQRERRGVCAADMLCTVLCTRSNLFFRQTPGRYCTVSVV